jgi:hypothetical protein
MLFTFVVLSFRTHIPSFLPAHHHHNHNHQIVSYHAHRCYLHPRPLRSNMTDIRSIVRERFMGMVRRVQPNGGWKVLIIDEESTKIISGALSMYDIMEDNVSGTVLINCCTRQSATQVQQ